MRSIYCRRHHLYSNGGRRRILAQGLELVAQAVFGTELTRTPADSAPVEWKDICILIAVIGTSIDRNLVAS